MKKLPADFEMNSDTVIPNMTTHGGVLYYVVKVPKHQQGSVESGWDNPFRPGGDLSREADEIVELIKGGKPITPTPGQQPPSLEACPLNHSLQDPITESPKKSVASQNSSAPPNSNGTAKNDVGAPPKPLPQSLPGAVVVQRGTVKPDGDASQIEHVIIKKKPKCQCCVIQ